MKDNGEFDKKHKTLAIIKFALLMTVVVGIPIALYLIFGRELFGEHFANRMIAFLTDNRTASFLLIILVQALQVIICIIPGQPIQFAASYMFGIVIGYVLSIIGAVLGAAIAFLLAKLLGRDALYLFFGKEKVDDYQRKLNSGRGLMLVGLIYLIPGVPKDLVAYVAGISDMRFRPFLLVSTVARSPGMIGSLLFGHFLSNKNYSAIAALAAVMIVLLVVFYIKRKSIVEFLDRVEASGCRDKTDER